MLTKLINDANHFKNYNYNFGWINGLNSVNQSKYYVFRNAILFEKSLKKDIHYCGHPPCALSLYYLTQEPHFNTWYNKETAEKLREGRDGTKF